MLELDLNRVFFKVDVQRCDGQAQVDDAVAELGEVLILVFVVEVRWQLLRGVRKGQDQADERQPSPIKIELLDLARF